MAITKRKNRQGKVTGYQVSVSVPDPKTGKVVRDVVGTFTRRGEADKAQRTAKVKIDNGTYELEPPAPPKVWTVDQVVKNWLTGKRATVSANSHSQYASAYDRHLEKVLGDRDIATLTRADVKAALRKWQAAGMGAQLQNRTMLVLRGALDEAVEDGVLAANPASGIRLPSPKHRRDIPHWTPDHLARFLDEGERDQLGVFWHLAALEGFRRAEALALRWSDLAWNDEETACRATIVQTVVADAAHGGAPLIQPKAKTKGSQRTVMLTASTVSALRRHRDRQTFQRQAAGDLWPDELDLIVTNGIGGVIRPDAVAAHRRAVIDRAGVPDPGTHGLRHLAATAMLRGGVNLAMVSQKIGHSDIGTTSNTYGHLQTSDQQAANDAMEAFLARAKPTGTG